MYFSPFYGENKCSQLYNFLCVNFLLLFTDENLASNSAFWILIWMIWKKKYFWVIFSLFANIKSNEPEKAQKSKNVINKCALEFNFVCISGILIFLNKVKNVVPVVQIWPVKFFKKYCGTGLSWHEFCPWLLLFEYRTGGYGLSSSFCPYF